MQIIIYSVLVILLVVFFVAWLWGMWIAFTQGDDVIAKFGRRVLSKIRPTQRPPDAGDSGK